MRRRVIIETVITIVLIAIVFLTGGMSIYLYYIDNKSQIEYELLKPTPVVQKVPSVATGTTTEAEEVKPKNYPELYIDYGELEGKNPDFVGWFYFPALNLSYPLVQGADNDFYLEHSFEKADNHAGCIFVDYAAATNWSDRNTFIFGHNMRDESMFGQFKHLMKNPSPVEENPLIYIYTQSGVYTYEVFAIYETRSNSDRYMTFKEDDTYDEYVQWAKVNSVMKSDRDMSDRSNLISLSTCYGQAGTKKRVLMHAALNAVEE